MPMTIFRLLVQSTLLALSQIWVNKTRSILTTLGIIIGVSSVSAVIAAMSGMNSKIMENFEIFGTKKIFIWPGSIHIWQRQTKKIYLLQMSRLNNSSLSWKQTI